MKIFLSWSGDTSREIAEAFYAWLPCVLQQTIPFFSEEMESGEISFNRILSELNSCSLGLVLLTEDNLVAPWIMFEAGALSRDEDRRVCPILFGVEKSDVGFPLKYFQFTLFLKDDIQKLVNYINTWSGEEGISPSLLSTTFEKWWPGFDKKIKEILRRKRVKRESLKEVLGAFDEEMSRIQSGDMLTQRATGTKLARLGELAILEKGELDVAVEAFMSLLRLSNLAPHDSIILNSFASPGRTPQLSTVKLLSTIQQDWKLIYEVVRRAKIYALIGDVPDTMLSNYSKIPNGSWKAVVDIFYHYTKFGTDHSNKDWSGGEIMMSLTQLLVGLGIVYTKRGLTLPEPPTEIRITSSDERGVGPDQSAEILPYVYIANKIAMLPTNNFEFALKQLERYNHPVTQVFADPENYMLMTLEEAKNEILSWAIRPGQESTFIAVSSEESKNVCVKLVQELQETGQKVSAHTKAFLIGERSCAESQFYLHEGTNASYACRINMETDTKTFSF